MPKKPHGIAEDLRRMADELDAVEAERDAAIKERDALREQLKEWMRRGMKLRSVELTTHDE